MSHFELHIDDSTQYATAYLDDAPLFTVARRRVMDKVSPPWASYRLDGSLICTAPTALTIRRKTLHRLSLPRDL